MFLLPVKFDYCSLVIILEKFLEFSSSVDLKYGNKISTYLFDKIM